jgi:membrane-bound serine protease (ClpP class)
VKIGKLWWFVLLGFFLSASAAQVETGAPARGSAIMIEIGDAIGPATSDYFTRSLKIAGEQHAPLFIVQIDTPGGLDSAMRDMIQAVLASPIPVVLYVAPSGARAASAGTYLLYASHIAAMAPATNLGAATPIQIGGSPPPDRDTRDDREDKENEKDPETDRVPEPGTAAERKAVNDAVAYIRGLAELRDRNAEWAESAVRSGTSISASVALKEGVIDVIANDVDELLQQIDGRTIKLSSGDVKLATAGLTVERIEIDWRTRLLSMLTNPNVAYLLMLMGVYGLLLEGYNPGAILPGVVGGISLILALYAFQVLSVNYAGLALMALGIALIVGEAFAPSFGVLGIGGIIAFVFGSIILLDNDVPGFQIATSLIAAIATGGGIVMLLMVTYFARSRRQPVTTGSEQLLREQPIALADFTGEGQVRIHGEIWNAITSSPVKAGQRLRVIRVDGLTLHVEPRGTTERLDERASG